MDPAEPDPNQLARRGLSALAIDLGPLRRHRDFRLLFVGQGVSFLGSMVTYVAIPYQAYQITGSSLVVGLISAAELVPLLTMPFVGGALADAVDRRRMVRLCEAALMLASAVLLVNAVVPDPHLWVLFVVAAAMATVDGLQRPSLEALTPRLVTREEIPAASALAALRGGLGMVAGPPVGGVVIALAGLPAAYALDIASFGASLTALTLMRAVPPPPDADRPSLRGVIEGLRYAAGRPELVGTYAVDIVAMFFGIPRALFPALADDFGGAGVLGLMYAAPAVGALVATLTSGWTARVHHHGLGVIVAAAAWGVAITAFGLTDWLPLALACLAAAGAADMTSGLFRMTIWNQTIPDELRGRLAGIEMVSYTSGPLLGNVESGVAAALFGVRASVVSGGVLCVAGVTMVAAALPRFRRYDARAS